MGQAEVDAHPDCMSSGDYHKNGKKKIVLVVWGVPDPHGNTMAKGMTQEMASRASTRCPR
jgi:hypothetical protein